MATPYYLATNSRSKAFLMATLSGLSEPLGALLSLVFLKPFMIEHSWLVEYILCFVGGLMLAVSLGELIPEALKYKRHRTGTIGFVSGFVIMLATIYVLET